MLKYVILRTLLIIPILLAVTFITFAIVNFTPGNPARMLLGDNAPPEAVELLNHQFGVDRPFFERFFNYVSGIVTRFDFGLSWRTQKPIVGEMLDRFPYTLTLASLSVVLSTLIGIPVGILLAAKRVELVDRSVNAIGIILTSIPTFVLGLLLMLLFAVELQWLRVIEQGWKMYILPLVAIVLPAAVSRMRLARTTMLEAIRQEYVTMARSKGIPEGRVIFVHALKNSMIPLVTNVIMSFSAMLGGALIVERVFAIPGLGNYMVNAILQKDMPTILTSTLFMAAIFCVTMLILDIIYALIDPRIKARYVKIK